MSTENSPSASTSPQPAAGAARNRVLLWTAVVMLILMAILFNKSLDSDMVHFSNDGPHGLMMTSFVRVPSTLTGIWCDINWLGSESIMPAPSITTLLRLIFLNPQSYGRILYPAAMFTAAMGACFFFKKLKLAPVACVVGAIAAGLSTDFLSTACWGVASQVVGFGCMYAALALITDDSRKFRWARIIMAGMAVGMGIMEAYDIAALFSIVVGFYVIYESYFLRPTTDSAPASKKLGGGFIRLATVIIFSAFIATHSLNILVGTQLKGIVGMAQDAETKKSRFSEATIWSLPREEALQIFIPGVFGYRMDAEHGQNYWGTIGKMPYMDEAERILRDPRAPDSAKQQAQSMLAQGNWRFSGTGYYQGVIVLMIAIWGIFQSFRADKSPFTKIQRRAIWFWTVFAVITVPLAFGKYAPFYSLWYAIPYASVIRNPTKFMHIFSWVMIILFAYGLHGLYVGFMKQSASRGRGLIDQFKTWWAKAGAFDKKWLTGCAITAGVGLMGWLIYNANKSSLQAHLLHVAIPKEIAPDVADYSVNSVLWFTGLVILGTVLMGSILCGYFSGARAKTGVYVIGLLVCFDLGRAALPWPHYWNVAYKYATNPVVDFLKVKPYENRVEMNPFRAQSPQTGLLQAVFDIEWQQQVFPFYNIPTLKMFMEPRVTEDKAKFLTALPPQNNNKALMLRNWELTSSRFLLGNGPDFRLQAGGPTFLEILNDQIDPEKKRFRAAKFPDGRSVEFKLDLKSPALDNSLAAYTAVPDPEGELGLVEFMGALPRASLFANWEINTNLDACLTRIADLTLDVHKTTIISDATVPKANPANADVSPGTAEINPNYQPKRIQVDADVKVPSILMLTDRYNENWKVKVDDKPANLLRCDYIMRGTYLEKGKHTVVFTFEPQIQTLKVSLVAIALGLCLIALLTFSKEETSAD